MSFFKAALSFSVVILGGVVFLGCDGSSPKESKKSAEKLFSESAPSQKLSFEGGKCNMETINGVNWDVKRLTFSKDDKVSIVGWGVDVRAKRAPSSVFVRVQSGGRIFYVEAAKTERTDVARYFNEDYYKDSGYKADVSLKGLPEGEYWAMIVMTFPDKAILCASGRTFVIK